MKKKCDICKKEQQKGQHYMPVFKQTTKEYAPKKDSLTQKIIYRTKEVFVCPDCYLTKIKHKKLVSNKQEKQK